MTTKYLVLSLKEKQFVFDAYLSTTGLTTHDEFMIMGKNEGLFDTLNEAIKEAEGILSSDHPEIGVEIRPVFVMV